VVRAVSERFPRVNLAEIDPTRYELVLCGLAYRGLSTQIVGPTGVGKTVLATRLILEGLRSGEFRTPAHFDQEIGEGGTKATYLAHGATAAELAAIHYLGFPEVRRQEVALFVQDILDEGEDLTVFDKKPDFLRSLGLAENSNDDQSDFYGSLVDPLRTKVTTLILAPTGHVGDFGKGQRARGGSESDYKLDLIWIVSVVEPFDREKVGRLQLTCDKDRPGYIGKGTTVTFEIGGDGQGRIVFRRIAGGPATTREDAVSLEAFLMLQAIKAGRHIAPDEAKAKSMDEYLVWLDANLPQGKRGSKEQRIAAIKRACELPTSQDRLVEIDTGVKHGRHTLSVRYYAAGEEA
jgi:hypothetical protein